MTSYQKLKERIEKLEHDKTLLLKSIVYSDKIDCDECSELLSLQFDFMLLNQIYNKLMEGNPSGEHPTGIMNIN